MFVRHLAEITVMQFTGHSLPVHQSISVPWDFNPVPHRQASSPTPMEYALPRLWNGMSGGVEGQYTTHFDAVSSWRTNTETFLLGKNNKQAAFVCTLLLFIKSILLTSQDQWTTKMENYVFYYFDGSQLTNWLFSSVIRSRVVLTIHGRGL